MTQLKIKIYFKVLPLSFLSSFTSQYSNSISKALQMHLVYTVRKISS